MAAVRLGEIVARFGGELIGDGDRTIVQVASLEQARPDEISFLSHPKYRSQLSTTRAGAVILSRQAAAASPSACIVSEQPYLYFARVSRWLNPGHKPPAGIHPTATVASRLPASVSVGAGAVIGEACTIGENVVVGPGCVVGAGVAIGADSLLHAKVSVYPGCLIGRRAIVHAGAVIGADGFGFARDERGAGVKIPQTGRVLIGDDVEIGANTTIDRGALDDTVIGDGVKIDNLVQVAHNVRIGEHTAIAGCVGISGSARIGAYCLIGGGVGIAGHLEIADRVVVGGMSLVSRSIRRSGHYTGAFPLDTHDNWAENAATLRQLARLRDRIRQLEQQNEARQPGDHNPS